MIFDIGRDRIKTVEKGGGKMTREEVARILKESRITAGLTQKQAAEALGRAQQTLASWETGKSQPDANTLFVLFDIYGLSVDEAFGFNEKEWAITPRERRLITAYRKNAAMQSAVDRLLGIDSEITEEIAPPVEPFANDKWWGDNMTYEQYMSAASKRWDDRKNAEASFSTSANAGS